MVTANERLELEAVLGFLDTGRIDVAREKLLRLLKLYPAAPPAVRSECLCRHCDRRESVYTIWCQDCSRRVELCNDCFALDQYSGSRRKCKGCAAKGALDAFYDGFVDGFENGIPDDEVAAEAKALDEHFGSDAPKSRFFHNPPRRIE